MIYLVHKVKTVINIIVLCMFTSITSMRELLYPVSFGQQLHTCSRQDCQELLEWHKRLLKVKGQL